MHSDVKHALEDFYLRTSNTGNFKMDVLEDSYWSKMSRSTMEINYCKSSLTSYNTKTGVDVRPKVNGSQYEFANPISWKVNRCNRKLRRFCV